MRYDASHAERANLCLFVCLFVCVCVCACVKPSLSDSDDLEEMERLRKDHIEALREIKRLQVH